MSKNNYTLGFDLGNRTVASTVIDDHFNVVKKHHQRLAEVNVFNEGKSKAEAREHRDARHNLQHTLWRKKQLIRFFREYASFDINGVVHRFKASRISSRDPKRKQVLTPVLYLSQYKTVWFAVDALLSHDAKRLPKGKAAQEQLIFEVFHNLLTRRGHFLTPQLTVDQFENQQFDFKLLGEQLIQLTNQITESDWQFDTDKFNQILLSDVNASELSDQLTELLGKSALAKVYVKLIAGYKVNKNAIATAFGITSDVATDLQFGKDNTADKLDELADMLSSKQNDLLTLLLQIYMSLQLTDLQNAGESFIAARKDEYFQFQHEHHLVLNELAKHPNEKFNKIRKQYVHAFKGHGGKDSVKYNDYIQALKTYLGFIANGDQEPSSVDTKFRKDYKTDLPEDCDLRSELDKIIGGQFMLKTRSLRNTRIPNQAIKSVIRQIVDSWKDEFPYLARAEYIDDPWFKDEKYDLERFFDFKVPYFIGHFKEETPTSWAVYRTSGPLTVFNFSKKIDFPKTAKRFIRRQTGLDLYLLDEPVLPTNSMVYQRFKVLDELSNMSIKPQKWMKWRKLNGQEKSFLLGKRGPFITGSRVSLKAMFTALKMEFNYFKDVEKKHCNYVLRGLSDEADKGAKAYFNNALSVRRQLTKAGLEESAFDLHQKDIERIIEILTVYDKDSVIIKDHELKKLQWLDDSIRQRLTRMSLPGWGRYSYKLLVEMKSPVNHQSVLDNLENGSQNLLQVVTDESLGFKQQIEKHCQQLMAGKSVQDKIDDILGPRFISPANRKALAIFTKTLDYNVKQLGCDPKLIVIESARMASKGKNKTATKYNRLKVMLKKASAEIRKEFKQLDSKEPINDKTYLYFSQEGKDIYTGKSLGGLNAVMSHPERYDIDHIVPRSVTKDDSLDNRVLVYKAVNIVKTNDVLSRETVRDQRAVWQDLKKRGMMSAKKFSNLVTDWSKNDLKVDFLNRSLVETNQINKLAAQIASIKCPNSTVIMLNSAVTHHLRNLDQQYINQILRQKGINQLSEGDLAKKPNLNIYKNRSVNDLHHIVDSYLVAMGGFYLWEKYDWLHPWLDYSKFVSRKKFWKGQNGQKLTLYLKNHGINPADLGFGDLTATDLEDGLIVNNDSNKVIDTQAHLQSRLRCLQYPDFLENVRYEYGVSLAGKAQVGKTTIHQHGSSKKMIPVHRNWDPKIYGYRQNENHRYFVIVSLGDNKSKFVWIPMNLEKTFFNDEKALHDYVISSLSSSQRKKAKIVSHLLPIGQRLKTIDGDFEFRIMGPTGAFTLARQLLLQNDDIRVINDMKKASIDELQRVIIDIVKYESSVNGYLVNLSKTFMGHILGDDFIQDVKDCDDHKALEQLIQELLIEFHCDPSRVDKLEFSGFTAGGRLSSSSLPKVEIIK